MNTFFAPLNAFLNRPASIQRSHMAAVVAGFFVLGLMGLSPTVQAQSASAAPVKWTMANLNRANDTWTYQRWLADEMIKRSGGRIQVEMISMPELGLTGFELVRVMRAGLLDVGEVITGYVAGDLPIVEGPSLTGLQPDWEASRKSQKAWEPVYRKHEAQIGGKYLGSHPYDWNAAWCVKPMRKLEDLKGVKIRIFSPAMGLFWKELGAEPVSMAYAEIYSALERKVLDCSHTGPASGMSVKLNDVTKNLIDLRLGHQPGLIIASKKKFDALPKDLQQMLENLGTEYTERTWNLGWEVTQREIKKAQASGVEWAPMKPEYTAIVQGIVQKVILPDWLNRVKDKDEAVREFNQRIAPIVGVTAVK